MTDVLSEGWFAAYGPCSRGCEYDADAYVVAGFPIHWRCGFCGEWSDQEIIDQLNDAYPGWDDDGARAALAKAEKP